MAEYSSTGLRIAIAGQTHPQRLRLQQAMLASGWQVVICETLSSQFVDKISELQPDVVLLDLHDDGEHDPGLFDQLLEDTEVPIIFNDDTALTLNEPQHYAKWQIKLMRKVAASTGYPLPESLDSISMQIPQRRVFNGELARNVWVLGASLGGPESVKRFLKEIPKDLPVAFVLVQHLGANFVHLLAAQLDQVCRFDVMRASNGHVLRHGQVVVSPADQYVTINPIGAIELQKNPETCIYNPSIDFSLDAIGRRFPEYCGAIIFSGMGDDGKHGVHTIQSNGGRIWAQEPTSCVVSSMPDNARRTGVVSFSGTPEQLAHQLIGEYNHQILESVQ